MRARPSGFAFLSPQSVYFQTMAFLHGTTTDTLIGFCLPKIQLSESCWTLFESPQFSELFPFEYSMPQVGGTLSFLAPAETSKARVMEIPMKVNMSWVCPTFFSFEIVKKCWFRSLFLVCFLRFLNFLIFLLFFVCFLSFPNCFEARLCGLQNRRSLPMLWTSHGSPGAPSLPCGGSYGIYIQ